jgi:uncharacterized protein
MPGPAVLFREIHRLRRQARELQDKLDRLPRQLKAQQARVAQGEATVREAQEAIRKLKVTTHEKEVTLKTRQGQIAKYQKQLNEAGSPKEYDALKLEIEHAKKDCAQLEDEILNAMMETDERTAGGPELEKAAKQMVEEAAAFEKVAAKLKTELGAQVSELRGQIQKAETGIPANIRSQYTRIVTAKDADGFAEVRDRTCSACNTELPAQTHQTLSEDMFMTCSCSRILYLPEQPPEEDDDSLQTLTDEA